MMVSYYGEALEKIASPPEECFQSADEKAFPEPARMTEEIVFASIKQSPYKTGFIYISKFSLDYIGEILYSYRIFQRISHSHDGLSLNYSSGFKVRK